jgi:hypothetical protein
MFLQLCILDPDYRLITAEPTYLLYRISAGRHCPWYSKWFTNGLSGFEFSSKPTQPT